MVAPCWGFCLPEPIGPGPPEPPLFFLPYQEPSTTVGTASDSDKVLEYFELTLRGLVWHEWAAVVPDDYAVEIFTLAPEAFKEFSAKILSLGGSTKVHRSFAKGALQYAAARSPKDPAFSTWHITLYEGLGLADIDHTDGRLEVVGFADRPRFERFCKA